MMGMKRDLICEVLSSVPGTGQAPGKWYVCRKGGFGESLEGVAWGLAVGNFLG